LYGLAEILTSIYALAIPWLLRSAEPLLQTLYGTGHGAEFLVLLLRATFGSAILFPATVLMGATLPLLAGWIFGGAQTEAGRRVNFLYSGNLAGATIGAFLSGFALLPSFGFSHTLAIACACNGAIGLTAVWMARERTQTRNPELRKDATASRDAASGLALPSRIAIPVAFLSGGTCLLYEVAWGRVYGLLFGPTASTLTLILAVFLAGLSAGSVWAGRLKHNLEAWLSAAQLSCALALLAAVATTGVSPPWIADWVRVHNSDPLKIEAMKVVLLGMTLLPLTLAFGLIFPLTMRTALTASTAFASRIGGLYGINTAGCIAGSLSAGWFFIPLLGTERTLLLGGLLNLGLGLWLLDRLRPAWRKPLIVAACAGPILAGLFAPRWDMTAMTAGAYKYAPYYANPAAPFIDAGELLWVREGTAGTVAVRKEAGSLVLSIDGKVDASDAGGDLLTEKLLAHLPLLLAPGAKRICLIGLASGVTAGAALTHDIQQLDVVEISRDVVHASHYFDAVNGRPLADPRVTLLVNDGRSHLALASSSYDVIISEPSNPWIAGMNSLFTRDFFRIARRRLRRNGIFAQWFHIYNMPLDDLRSLLAAFQEAFPSAMLWKLNDGDILLTGIAGEPPIVERRFPPVSERVRADLSGVGVEDPKLLLDLYVMRDGDIRSFANGAPVNTDDHPWLEFHGQRDLHAQTDPADEAALLSSSKRAPEPAAVRELRENMTAQQYLASGRMFEHAESYRSAFRSYQQAWQRDAGSVEALAGMDRSARLPEQRTAVIQALGLTGASDTSEKRTELAIRKERGGQTGMARLLFEETALAHPDDPAARFNFGIFCLEQKDYADAIAQFNAAIRIDAKYLPAYEALAESYLQLHDFDQAAVWTRRILALNPNHSIARQTLATLEHRLAERRSRR
jgi:spermidine synthase